MSARVQLTICAVIGITAIVLVGWGASLMDFSVTPTLTYDHVMAEGER